MQIPDHAVFNAPSLMCDIRSLTRSNLLRHQFSLEYGSNCHNHGDSIQIHFACKSLWPQVVTRSRPLSANEERERDALEMFPPSLDRILFISFIRASHLLRSKNFWDFFTPSLTCWHANL